MPERTTAEDRLHRLLWLIPAAARTDGASLDALARELAVSPRELLDDIHEATAATFHHPGGHVEAFSIDVQGSGDGQTVHVRTTGQFTRPSRLTPREAFALVVGLRALAAHAEPQRRDHIRTLAARLEDELCTIREEATSSPAQRARDAVRVEAVIESRVDASACDELIADAAQRQRRCRIRYIKPGSAQPSERIIEPWRLAFGDGWWYVIARDVERDTLRLFRLDRIAAVSVLEEESFDVPAEFDPAAILRQGLAFMASERDEQVSVRYDDPAARWVAEAHGRTRDAAGRLTIEHAVADRRWIVRHVLAFGGAAEVIRPDDLRHEVGRIARALAEGA